MAFVVWTYTSCGCGRFVAWTGDQANVAAMLQRSRPQATVENADMRL